MAAHWRLVLACTLAVCVAQTVLAASAAAVAYARKSMMSRWWFQVHRAVQVCSRPLSGFLHAHLHRHLLCVRGLCHENMNV